MCNAAPPIESNSRVSAAAVAAAEARCRNITSLTSGPDPTCWNTLRMDNWMRKWKDSPQACAQYEPWGNCFMRLANKGAAGIDFINHFLVKLYSWDFYHQPEGYSANVARVVNFLNSNTMPWVNDTGLRTLGRGVARIMDATWRNGTLNGDFKDSTSYNLDNVLWRTLKKWESGDFLRLAENGTLLHSPL
ncbi:MAG: hypothetical protein Q9219_001264 [cf. Caloplaca sp. 3 TL-2023]